MDKRAYSLVASHKEELYLHNLKKPKVSVPPIKVTFENYGNSNIVDELDGLFFDDEDDEDFCNKVSTKQILSVPWLTLHQSNIFSLDFEEA